MDPSTSSTLSATTQPSIMNAYLLTAILVGAVDSTKSLSRSSKPQRNFEPCEELQSSKAISKFFFSVERDSRFLFSADNSAEGAPSPDGGWTAVNPRESNAFEAESASSLRTTTKQRWPRSVLASATKPSTPASFKVDFTETFPETRPINVEAE